VITIVDYGIGNIGALENCYKRLNIKTRLASDAGALDGSERLILPGVGAYDTAIERLNASGMRDKLDTLVLDTKLPVLGICVGMQMLGTGSDEGRMNGLDWVAGRSKLFPSSCKLVPHLGWNDVVPTVTINALFKDLEQDARFYFLHSYYFEALHSDTVSAQTSYGFTFDCALSSGNVHGVQFHPEKSHSWGATLLKNFAEV